MDAVRSFGLLVGLATRSGLIVLTKYPPVLRARDHCTFKGKSLWGFSEGPKATEFLVYYRYQGATDG
jgi:hypothetical protein